MVKGRKRKCSKQKSKQACSIANNFIWTNIKMDRPLYACIMGLYVKRPLLLLKLSEGGWCYKRIHHVVYAPWYVPVAVVSYVDCIESGGSQSNVTSMSSGPFLLVLPC